MRIGSATTKHAPTISGRSEIVRRRTTPELRSATRIVYRRDAIRSFVGSLGERPSSRGYHGSVEFEPVAVGSSAPKTSCRPTLLVAGAITERKRVQLRAVELGV